MELKINIENKNLNSPQEVMKAINTLWSQYPEYDKSRENSFILYLNTKNKLLCVELHSQGTIDQSIIYPREIIRKALFCNAAGIILIHNHPSGTPEPSRLDINFTEKLKTICEAMDILILDHIIIGENSDNYYSFQSQGIL